MSLRVGVLGTGRMGTHRAQVLSRHPAVSSVVVGGRDPERARAVAEPVGGVGGTVEDALERDLDAVVISSSTSEHAGQIAECLQRGLPILCEKPLALTLDDTERILRSVQEVGVQLQVAYDRRHDAAFRAARDRVAAGQLGTLYGIRMCAHDHEPSEERFIPSSGGIFRDLHVHDFDMARWLTGCEVERVFAIGQVRVWERFGRYADFDSSAIVVTMTDGLSVLISGSRHNPLGYDFRTEILGSSGSIALGLDRRTPIEPVGPDAVGPPAKPYIGFLDRFRDAYSQEIAAFVDLVVGRGPNLCPGGEDLAAMRVAVACDRSVELGAPVEVASI